MKILSKKDIKAKTVPFHMLELPVTKIKEIKLSDGLIERWYEDKNGNRATILKKSKISMKEIKAYKFSKTSLKVRAPNDVSGMLMGK